MSLRQQKFRFKNFYILFEITFLILQKRRFHLLQIKNKYITRTVNERRHERTRTNWAHDMIIYGGLKKLYETLCVEIAKLERTAARCKDCVPLWSRIWSSRLRGTVWRSSAERWRRRFVCLKACTQVSRTDSPADNSASVERCLWSGPAEVWSPRWCNCCLTTLLLTSRLIIYVFSRVPPLRHLSILFLSSLKNYSQKL